MRFNKADFLAMKEQWTTTSLLFAMFSRLHIIDGDIMDLIILRDPRLYDFVKRYKSNYRRVHTLLVVLWKLKVIRDHSVNDEAVQYFAGEL